MSNPAWYDRERPAAPPAAPPPGPLPATLSGPPGGGRSRSYERAKREQGGLLGMLDPSDPAFRRGAEFGAEALVTGAAGGLGGRVGLGATKWAAGKVAPRLLPALEGTPGFWPAVLRAVGRAPLATRATYDVGRLYQKYARPDLSPEEQEQTARYAAGAEAAMQGLSPFAHPAGRLALKVMQKIPGVEQGLNWVYQKIPMIGRGLKGQRAGADEAIEMLERARVAQRGAGGHITLAQTLDNRIIQEAEGAVEAAFGAGPLLTARKRAQQTLQSELYTFADELAARSPDGVLQVLEAVIAGSGEVHKTYVRAAYQLLDEAVEGYAKRTGNPIRVDLTEAFEEAKKWGIMDPAIRRIQGGPAAIYDTMMEIGQQPGFADAHMLQAAINATGKNVEKIMGGKAEKFAKRMSFLINKAMDEAADKIPSKVMPQWQTASRRSGAQVMEEVPVPGAKTIREVHDDARRISRQGKEIFNESVIAPLMRAATPEQFSTATLKGARGPETIRVVREIIFNPRNRHVIKEMGEKDGIPNYTPDDLWDGVRGRWLQDQLRRSVTNKLEHTVGGTQLIDKLQYHDVQREMFPELFSRSEQGNVIDWARGLAASQVGATGSAGANVIRLAQFGAGTALFIPGAQEHTGEVVPWAIVLGPVALARVLGKRSLVRTLNRGIGGKVAMTGMGRFSIQFLRQMAEEGDIPFTVELTDGSTYNHDTKQREAAAANRTSIPTP